MLAFSHKQILGRLVRSCCEEGFVALSTKLMIRQGQSLVMTPQLLQAIKLLQFSSTELSAFLDEEMERNPLLQKEEAVEMAETGPAPVRETIPEPEVGDWARADFLASEQGPIADLGLDIGNAYESPEPTRIDAQEAELSGLSTSAWSGTGAGGGERGEGANLEAYVSERPSLQAHLNDQLSMTRCEPDNRIIGAMIIDAIDETGYLRESVEEIAQRLDAPESRVAEMLKTIQGFDPCGVGARDLAECLAIQLREGDRFDPAMQIFIANLPLVARRDYARLSRLCGVDEEDIADMAAEIRRLDPKPGRAFSNAPVQPIIPDVLVRAAKDGSWLVELNSEALPRVLVNHNYAAQVSVGARGVDKTFISTCLQNANWLTKSLEQRGRTILKVASEIVRLQDAFLTSGVQHLRPLNLRTIADAIGMHESTVSRVTSNKYMMTPRGLFELKYFFSASIATTTGREAHSAEAVRFRIRQMIDRETPENILSDDAIVARLKAADIDIARRTVAKYRDSLHIPSSVDRRRSKQLEQRRTANG